jgi:hypothetical protein
MDKTGADSRALRLVSPLRHPWPPAEDSVAVSYLSSIASVHTYRGASSALNGLAFDLVKIPDAGRYYPWAMLRQRNTAAIRTWLDRRLHTHPSSTAHINRQPPTGTSSHCAESSGTHGSSASCSPTTTSPQPIYRTSR